LTKHLFNKHSNPGESPEEKMEKKTPLIKFSTWSRLMQRIMVLPAVFLLLSVSHGFFVIRRTWHFLRFGGEFIQYNETDSTTIQDIYKELQKANNV